MLRWSVAGIGDLSVYLPKEKILFMSEAYLNRIFPAMRSAYPSEWVATIEKAQAMDVNVFVPGHGFVESPAILKEELETFRRAIVQVIGEAKRLKADGLDADVVSAFAGDVSDAGNLFEVRVLSPERRRERARRGQHDAVGQRKL